MVGKRLAAETPQQLEGRRCPLNPLACTLDGHQLVSLSQDTRELIAHELELTLAATQTLYRLLKLQAGILYLCGKPLKSLIEIGRASCRERV